MNIQDSYGFFSGCQLPLGMFLRKNLQGPWSPWRPLDSVEALVLKVRRQAAVTGNGVDPRRVGETHFAMAAATFDQKILTTLTTSFDPSGNSFDLRQHPCDIVGDIHRIHPSTNGGTRICSIHRQRLDNVYTIDANPRSTNKHPCPWVVLSTSSTNPCTHTTWQQHQKFSPPSQSITAISITVHR